jgi:hypothetical protein
MDAHPADASASVVTSLPDVSEIEGRDLDVWRAWFVDAARRVVRWVPDAGAAIFYQSDLRRGGLWIDKGYLVARAAEDAGAALAFHKIVCRAPPGTASHGRPTYSHLLGFVRSPRRRSPRAFPDVLPEAGEMVWSRATGVAACRLACEWLLAETDTTVVVDPFCGHGTVLAVANALGLDAIGVDLGARKCRAARRLAVDLETAAVKAEYPDVSAQQAGGGPPPRS